MSLDNQFGKGIGLAAGFDLGAQKPLDSRVAVNTIAERDAHVTENRAYEGMLVYVAETNMTYQLVKGEEEGQLVWKEFGFNQADFDGAFADSIEDVDNRLKAVEEDLAQGGETEGRIAQAEADIDALQGLVGNPADAENGASGLHLALDNAKKELNQAIATEKGRAEGQEAAIRQEMADALGNYSVEADENGEGGVEAAGLRKEIEDAHNAMNQAAAVEAERVNKKIADDIAAESALRVAEEQRIEKALADEAAEIRGEMAEQHQAMNKAVEEAIAAVQADVDQNEADCDAALAGEKERAEAKEAELLAAINKEVEDRGKAVQDLADRHDQEMDAAEGRLDVLEGLVGKPAVEGEEPADATGLHLALDNAKAELNQAIATEKGRAEGQEAAIRQELADEAAEIRGEIEELHTQLDADIEEQHQAMNEAMEAAVKGEKERAEGKEAELLQAINNEAARADAAEKANKAVIDKLDGAVDVEGSVKKQIKDAVDALQAVHDQEMDAAEGRIKANEDALAIVNGAEDVEGSIAKAEKDAKDYADQKIAGLIDSAPDAMNTLNELAKAINDNKDVYDGYVEQHAQAMAQQKADLQAEIDADVKVVADELAKQKDAEQEGTLANQIKVEKEAREAADTALDGRLQAVEASLGMGEGNEGIASRVEDLEEAIGKAAVPGSDEDPDGEAATGLHKVIDDKIAVLNGEVNSALDGLEKNVAAEKERAEKEEARIAGLVSTEKTRAEGEEARIEGLVTAEAQRAAAAEKVNADAIDALELALGAHLTTVSCGDNTVYGDLPSLTPPQA